MAKKAIIFTLFFNQRTFPRIVSAKVRRFFELSSPKPTFFSFFLKASERVRNKRELPIRFAKWIARDKKKKWRKSFLNGFVQGVLGRGFFRLSHFFSLFAFALPINEAGARLVGNVEPHPF